MTDEERARSMLGVLKGSVIEDKHTYLLAALAIVRADQIEKCAKRLDDMACDRLKDVHALTDVIHKHAARGSGKKAGKVAAYKRSMARRHLAYRDAAAAIRAMGDEE